MTLRKQLINLPFDKIQPILSPEDLAVDAVVGRPKAPCASHATPRRSAPTIPVSVPGRKLGRLTEVLCYPQVLLPLLYALVPLVIQPIDYRALDECLVNPDLPG